MIGFAARYLPDNPVFLYTPVADTPGLHWEIGCRHRGKDRVIFSLSQASQHKTDLLLWVPLLRRLTF